MSALTEHFPVQPAHSNINNDISHGTLLKVKCEPTKELSLALCYNGQWIVEDDDCKHTIIIFIHKKNN